MRTVLHFHPALAPVKIGVLPLSKKLGEEAEKVYAELCKYYNCNTTTEEISVSVTEDRMRSELRSV